jgi:hypothetical protein
MEFNQESRKISEGVFEADSKMVAIMSKIFWLDKWEGITSKWQIPFREFDMIEKLKKVKGKIVGIELDIDNHIVNFIYEAIDGNPDKHIPKAEMVSVRK